MRRDIDGAGYRHARLQEILFDEIRALLRDDISDPTLEGLRVLSVKLSVDYRSARIHVAVATGATESSELRKEVEEGLARAAPFLRYRLAVDLDWKRTPELRFVFDGAIPPEEEETP